MKINLSTNNIESNHTRTRAWVKSHKYSKKEALLINFIGKNQRISSNYNEKLKTI